MVPSLFEGGDLDIHQGVPHTFLAYKLLQKMACMFGILPGCSVAERIRPYLPPVTFISLHYLYFIGTCILTSVIFYCTSTPAWSITYTDSLFLVVSAMTEVLSQLPQDRHLLMRTTGWPQYRQSKPDEYFSAVDAMDAYHVRQCHIREHICGTCQEESV